MKRRTQSNELEVRTDHHSSIDHKQVAFYIMLLEGLGSLFPWNAFITASSYFSSRFCGTSFDESFENYFSLSSTLFQTLGLAVAVIYSHQYSFDFKIMWSLSLYATIFIITTAFVVISVPATLLFWLTLLSTSITGLLTASLSSGLFGLSAKFPPAYTGALMSGQGIAGLTASMSSIITTISSPSTMSCTDDGSSSDSSSSGCSQSTDYGAFAYFFVSTIVLAGCVLGYIVLRGLPFTKYHVEHELRDMRDMKPTISRGLLDAEAGAVSEKSSDFRYKPVIDEDDHPNDNRTTSSKKSYQSSDTQEREAFAMSADHLVEVMQQIAAPAVSVCYVFAVTIGLFPALIVFIESTEKCKTNNRFYDDLFVPVLFLIFNSFDFIGRICAGYFTMILDSRQTLIASGLRSVFFPAFMLCNVSNSRLPKVFDHDAWPILFMMLFALSNGYLASCCMMMGPGLVKKEQSSLAGTIMAFSLTFGLLLGACLSFVVVLVSRGSI